METKIQKRSEIKEEFKWNLDDLFISDEKWEETYRSIQGELPALEEYKGKISKDPAQLLELLKKIDRIGQTLSQIYNYAMQKNDEDTSVSKYSEMSGRAFSLYVAFSNAISFLEPEILSMDKNDIEKMMSENDGLQIYSVMLKRLMRKKEHVLSESEEKLLSMAAELGRSPDNIVSTFSNSDLKFPDVISNGEAVPLTNGSYIPLVSSTDRATRKDAFEKFYKVYKDYENTFASILDAQVKQLSFFAKARNYDSNLEASLFENEVPVEVYHNLIEAVHDGLPVMYKYMRIRKKLLGLDELHMYDIYNPMLPSEDTDISYEDAKKLCIEAVSPLGEDYADIMREGLENRWIDVYENEGKRSGAYSAGAIPHPYVLLNYQGKLDDASTLIHEMGHSIHSVLSAKNQPPVYREYVLFVAEVASTCNEVLLIRDLISKETDRRKKANLINQFLENFRTTMYRQTMFAEFELEINKLCEQGETLSAEKVDEIYYGLNKLYYGEGVVSDEQIAVEWARIPHFYYDFYVYQYATSYCAAVALADKILSEGKEAADRYKRFLSGGNSKDPITLLREAGVDMSTKKPIEDAIAVFDRLLDEFESLI